MEEEPPSQNDANYHAYYQRVHALARVEFVLQGAELELQYCWTMLHKNWRHVRRQAEEARRKAERDDIVRRARQTLASCILRAGWKAVLTRAAVKHLRARYEGSSTIQGLVKGHAARMAHRMTSTISVHTQKEHLVAECLENFGTDPRSQTTGALPAWRTEESRARKRIDAARTHAARKLRKQFRHTLEDAEANLMAWAEACICIQSALRSVLATKAFEAGEIYCRPPTSPVLGLRAGPGNFSPLLPAPPRSPPGSTSPQSFGEVRQHSQELDKTRSGSQTSRPSSGGTTSCAASGSQTFRGRHGRSFSASTSSRRIVMDTPGRPPTMPPSSISRAKHELKRMQPSSHVIQRRQSWSGELMQQLDTMLAGIAQDDIPSQPSHMAHLLPNDGQGVVQKPYRRI